MASRAEVLVSSTSWALSYICVAVVSIWDGLEFSCMLALRSLWVPWAIGSGSKLMSSCFSLVCCIIVGSYGLGIPWLGWCMRYIRQLSLSLSWFKCSENDAPLLAWNLCFPLLLIAAGSSGGVCQASPWPPGCAGSLHESPGSAKCHATFSTSSHVTQQETERSPVHWISSPAT